MTSTEEKALHFCRVIRRNMIALRGVHISRDLYPLFEILDSLEKEECTEEKLQEIMARYWKYPGLPQPEYPEPG